MSDVSEPARGRVPASTPVAAARPARRRLSRPVLLTTSICAVAAVAGHGILWAASAAGWMTSGAVPWQPVTGMVLATVAVVAFGGFYTASRRARVAIASGFLLTFLVALTYVVTIPGLAGAALGPAKVFFDEFRSIVAVIIGFYFGSETAVSVTKIIAAYREPANTAQIMDADRDLGSTR